MRQLLVKKVVIRHFRSFRDEVIEFPTSTGLKFLGGDNTVEPRLGANGAGKSSLLDSIVWCWYGRTARGLRTSAIITWGEKEVEVTTVLDVDGVEHQVTRSGPPERIYLDGKQLVQEELDVFLGLTRLRFLHSVLFGQGIPLFPDLSIPERGELFDEVLDLKIWASCLEAVGRKTKAIDLDLNKLRNTVSYLNGKLEALPSSEALQAQLQTWNAQLQQSVAALEALSSSWGAEHEVKVASVIQQMRQWEHEKNEEMLGIQQSKQAWDMNQRKAIAEQQKQEAGWAAEKQAQLEQIAAEMEQLEAQLAQVDSVSNLSELSLQTTKLAQQDTALAQQITALQREYYTGTATATAIQERLAAWNAFGECPTCHQQLSEEKRAEHIRKEQADLEGLHLEFNQTQLTEAQAQKQDLMAKLSEARQQETVERERSRTSEQRRQELNSRINQLESAANVVIALLERNGNPFTEQATRLQQQVNPFNSQIQAIHRRINPYDAQLDSARAEQNPYPAQIEEMKARVNPYEKQRLDVEIQRAELQEQLRKETTEQEKQEKARQAVDYWTQGFKRIRLYYIQQILSALEIEIASAISALGLTGWKVKLATEAETKSGTVKLGVQIYVRSPQAEGPWESWSGGETQRLRLAMAQGVSALILRAAGVRYPVEFWDEPTSWLSGEGIEDLLEALRYRAEAQARQIWVIDHRALTFSGFSEIWTVRKGEEGSKLFLLDRAMA